MAPPNGKERRNLLIRYEPDKLDKLIRLDRLRLMPGEGRSRRENLLLEAVDPVTGKPCVVQISHSRLMLMKKLGLWALKETAHILPQALKRPTAIFEGLCKDSDEDGRGYGWRCYVTVPDCSFREDGTKAEARSGQVFAVYVNDQHVVL